ncbi:MAG: hypothetical protein ACRCZJ_01565, partial [Erysipelotrichaceae bacterium]
MPKRQYKKLENKLNLMKLTHKPISRKDILDTIHVDERTLRTYASEGITINEVHFPITLTKLKQGVTVVSNQQDLEDQIAPEQEVFLRSSVHPIILPLNLSEVNMLTNQLLDLVERVDAEQYLAYKTLVSKIYSQLSVYGKENILNRHNLEILEEITYTPEATWLEEGKGMDYMFFYKSGEE